MDFIKDLILNGAEIYLVGGAVRNIIHNKYFDDKKKIKDKDLLICKMSDEQITKILRKYGKIKLVGISFGVLKFKPNNDQIEYDIALPRKEISTGPGYKDFMIETNGDITIYQDFERRDATINAIGKPIYNYDELHDNVIDLNIIDPFGGCDDIKNKKWRAIGDPLKRFSEDPIRILRAFRQCAELNYDIEDNTLKCIENNLQLLESINSNSRVRIMDEILRLLRTDCFVILKLMKTVGLLDIIQIPNISSNKNILIFDKLPQKINMKIRLALILNSHDNNECFKWCKYNNVGSSLYFSKYWSSFIQCVNKYYYTLDKVANDYDMRVLLQTLEANFQNFGKEFLIDLVDYYHIINGGSRFYNLLQNNVDFLLTINQVNINGTELIELFKLTGIEIKIIKTHLLEKINRDELKNVNKQIIDYLANYIK